MRKKLLICLLIASMMVTYMPSELFASINTEQSKPKVSLNLKWESIDGATKYVVYGNKVSTINKLLKKSKGKIKNLNQLKNLNKLDESKLKKVATVKPSDSPKYLVKKIKGKKLEAKTRYVLKVVAYNEDGRLGESEAIEPKTSATGTKSVASTFSSITNNNVDNNNQTNDLEDNEQNSNEQNSNNLKGNSLGNSLGAEEDVQEQVSVSFYSNGNLLESYFYPKDETLTDEQRKFPELLKSTATESFKGWYEVVGFHKEDANELPEVLTTSKSYYAKWEQKEEVQYTINYYIESIASKWTIGTTETKKAKGGETITINTPPESVNENHYYFDSTNSNNKLSGVNDGNLVLKLYYKPKTYTVTFVENPATAANAENTATTSFKYGDILTILGAGKGNLAGFSSPGYSFVGWSTDKDATEAEYTDGQIKQFEGDATLYGVWEGINYYVDYYVSGQKVGSQMLTYDKEEKLNLFSELNAEAKVKNGEVFDKWKVSGKETTYVDGETEAFNLTKTANQHVRLDATFKAKEKATYKTEYYKEKNDGSGNFELVNTKTSDLVEVGTTVQADENVDPTDYANYELDTTNNNAKTSGTVLADGSLTLRLFYKIAKSTYLYRVYQEVLNGPSDPRYDKAEKEKTLSGNVGLNPYTLETITGFELDTNKTQTQQINIKKDGSTQFNAYYKRIKYGISYEKTSDTLGQPELNGLNVTFPAVNEGKYGNKITIGSVSVPTGYKFDGWTCDDEKVEISGNAILSMPAKAVTLKAKISKCTYTVHYEVAEGVLLNKITDDWAKNFSNSFPDGTLIFGSNEKPKHITGTSDCYTIDGWYVPSEEKYYTNTELDNAWADITSKMQDQGIGDITLQFNPKEKNYESTFKTSINSEFISMSFYDYSNIQFDPISLSPFCTSKTPVTLSISTVAANVIGRTDTPLTKEAGRLAKVKAGNSARDLYNFIGWTDETGKVVSEDQELTVDEMKQTGAVYGHTYTANFIATQYCVEYDFSDYQEIISADSDTDRVKQFKQDYATTYMCYENFKPRQNTYKLQGHKDPEGWYYVIGENEGFIRNDEINEKWPEISHQFLLEGITYVKLKAYYEEKPVNMEFYVSSFDEEPDEFDSDKFIDAKPFNICLSINNGIYDKYEKFNIEINPYSGIVENHDSLYPSSANFSRIKLPTVSLKQTDDYYSNEFCCWEFYDKDKEKFIKISDDEDLTYDELPKDCACLKDDGIYVALYKPRTITVNYDIDEDDYPGATITGFDAQKINLLESSDIPKQNTISYAGYDIYGWNYSFPDDSSEYGQLNNGSNFNQYWNTIKSYILKHPEIKSITLTPRVEEKYSTQIFDSNNPDAGTLTFVAENFTDKGASRLEFSLTKIHKTLVQHLGLKRNNSVYTTIPGDGLAFTKVVAEPKAGYRFVGWTEDSTSNNPTITCSELKADGTNSALLDTMGYYKAVFQRDNYTIHYVDADGNKVYDDDTFDPTDTTKTPKKYENAPGGYSPDGWTYKDSKGTTKELLNSEITTTNWKAIVKDLVDNNKSEITLVAKHIEKQTSTLIYADTGGHVTVATNTISAGNSSYFQIYQVSGVYKGSEFKATATPNTGYVFEYWYLNGGTKLSTNEVLTANDIRDENGLIYEGAGKGIHAKFKECTYHITYQYDDVKHPNHPDGSTVDYGLNAFKTMNPVWYPAIMTDKNAPKDYEFTGWMINLSDEVQFTLETNDSLNTSWPYIVDKMVELGMYDVTLVAQYKVKDIRICFKLSQPIDTSLDFLYPVYTKSSLIKDTGETFYLDINPETGFVSSAYKDDKPENQLTDLIGKKFAGIKVYDSVKTDGRISYSFINWTDEKGNVVSTNRAIALKDLHHTGDMLDRDYTTYIANVDQVYTVHYDFGSNSNLKDEERYADQVVSFSDKTFVPEICECTAGADYIGKGWKVQYLDDNLKYYYFNNALVSSSNFWESNWKDYIQAMYNEGIQEVTLYADLAGVVGPFSAIAQTEDGKYYNYSDTKKFQPLTAHVDNISYRYTEYGSNSMTFPINRKTGVIGDSFVVRYSDEYPDYEIGGRLNQGTLNALKAEDSFVTVSAKEYQFVKWVAYRGKVDGNGNPIYEDISTENALTLDDLTDSNGLIYTNESFDIPLENGQYIYKAIYKKIDTGIISFAAQTDTGDYFFYDDINHPREFLKLYSRSVLLPEDHDPTVTVFDNQYIEVGKKFGRIDLSSLYSQTWTKSNGIQNQHAYYNQEQLISVEAKDSVRIANPDTGEPEVYHFVKWVRYDPNAWTATPAYENFSTNTTLTLDDLRDPSTGEMFTHDFGYGARGFCYKAIYSYEPPTVVITFRYNNWSQFRNQVFDEVHLYSDAEFRVNSMRDYVCSKYFNFQGRYVFEGLNIDDSLQIGWEQHYWEAEALDTGKTCGSNRASYVDIDPKKFGYNIVLTFNPYGWDDR